MQRPAQADCEHGESAHQPDNARRPAHFRDLGLDKRRRYRDREQDARPLQRDNDGEIRPGSPDKRNPGLQPTQISRLSIHSCQTHGRSNKQTLFAPPSPPPLVTHLRTPLGTLLGTYII